MKAQGTTSSKASKEREGRMLACQRGPPPPLQGLTMHLAPARPLQQAEAPTTPHWPVFAADESKTDAQGVSQRCLRSRHGGFASHAGGWERAQKTPSVHLPRQAVALAGACGNCTYSCWPALPPNKGGVAVLVTVPLPWLWHLQRRWHGQVGQRWAP